MGYSFLSPSIYYYWYIVCSYTQLYAILMNKVAIITMSYDLCGFMGLIFTGKWKSQKAETGTGMGTGTRNGKGRLVKTTELNGSR